MTATVRDTTAPRTSGSTALLHVITDLNVGGAQLALARLITHMDRDRFRHHVVSLLSSGPVAAQLTEAGIPVTSLDMRHGGFDVRALSKLRRLIHDWRPDVVDSWLYHADLLSTLAVMPGPRWPLVWNLRASAMDMRRYSWKSRATRRACAWLSGQPDLIVANSTAGRDFHQQIGYRARAWEIVFNGIDVDRYRPDADARDALARELGLAGARFVGLLARHDAMKGHDVFLEAARQIAEQRADVHFVLAGTGVEASAPFFHDWMTAHPAIAPRLHLLGQRRDTPRLMAALDVYCSPSLSEGFPNVVAEAMACGVPCAASDAGDSRAIVGDTGLVVPVGDAPGLARSCLALLAESYETTRQRGARARARIVDEFNLPRAVHAYERVFDNVLARRRARTRSGTGA
jgi:glycosyltransferase involved in cell wall biosynthesis